MHAGHAIAQWHLLAHAAGPHHITTARGTTVVTSNVLAVCSAPNSDETATANDAPTTATLARFALPKLAAWLVSPLMSLADTILTTHTVLDY